MRRVHTGPSWGWKTLCGMAVLSLLTLGACGGGDGGSGDGAKASSGGFELNLDDCADPDSVTKPIEGDIVIGMSVALSGPVAGPLADPKAGFAARIDEANRSGGIDGHKIKVIYRDDAFQPDKAKSNGVAFIEKDKIDVMTTHGASQLQAMADDQNAACVPMLYATTADPATSDMETYPWTVQYLPSAIDETKYQVKLIQDRVKDAVVGIAENQTAAGLAQSEAFQDAAKAAGLKIKKITPDTDPNAAATTLKDAGVNVVFHAAVAGTCGVFDTARARVGFEPELVVKPMTCSGVTEYIAAGKAADGVVVPSYLKDPTDPEQAADPAVKQYIKDIGSYKNSNSPNAVNGWVQGDIMVATLKQAAESSDGLNRASIIQAARGISYGSPLLREGIKWVGTTTEPAHMDGFGPAKWDSAAKRFIPDGDITKID